MHTINFQDKTNPREASIHTYWIENERTNIPLTRYHRITIPFDPFDSGLAGIEQPETTELRVDSIKIDVDDPAHLDGVVIAPDDPQDIDASIYIGYAHNPVDIKRIAFELIAPNHYRMSCKAFIDFEFENVAESEYIEFTTTARYKGED